MARKGGTSHLGNGVQGEERQSAAVSPLTVSQLDVAEARCMPTKIFYCARCEKLLHSGRYGADDS